MGELKGHCVNKENVVNLLIENTVLLKYFTKLFVFIFSYGKNRNIPSIKTF